MSNFGYFGLVALPETCTLEDWNGYGLHLARAVAELDRLQRDLSEKQRDQSSLEDDVRWALGDWYMKGRENKVKPAVIRKFIKLYFKCKGKGGKGYNERTIGNFATTSKAFSFSRRREKLSYSCHIVVAKFDDLKVQDQLLDLAEDRRNERGRQMSVRDLKACIKRQAGYWPAQISDKPKRHTVVTIRMLTSVYDKLATWAEAKSFNRDPKNGAFRPTPVPDVSRLIFWMANQFFQEHSADWADILKPKGVPSESQAAALLASADSTALLNSSVTTNPANVSKIQ
jgi:hypothetical protein